MTIRVIKVGGSLLDWPALGETLWAWLQAQGPARNYLLAGGGAIADAIRQADADHGLGEELSHQLCLEAMRITGKMLERMLATAKQSPGAPGDGQRSISVIDAAALLADQALTARVPEPLPHTWDVTSDSIAAYFAEALGAHELVLLKSAPLAGSMTFAEASAGDYVDYYFPTAAARVAKVRAVNLRGKPCREWLLFR